MSDNPFEYLSDAKKAKKDKGDKEAEIQRQKEEIARAERESIKKARNEKRLSYWQKYGEFVVPLMQDLIHVEYSNCVLGESAKEYSWAIHRLATWHTHGQGIDNMLDEYEHSEDYVYVGVDLEFNENDEPIKFFCFRNSSPELKGKKGMFRGLKSAEAELSSQDLLTALKTLHPPAS